MPISYICYMYGGFNMDIRQLNYFIQVADCGSYSVASQKLFVSQPALSKTIKNMEEELGITFFYTYQRRQHLTDAGQAFYDRAVHLVKEYNSLMDTSYNEAGINKGHLSIGLSAFSGSPLLSHVIAKFSGMFPMVEISITESETSLLKDDVIKRKLDAAFIDNYYLRNDDKKLLDIYDLAESDLVIVASVNNPISSMKKISYTDLDGKDLIIYQRSDSPTGQLAFDFKVTTAKPKIVLASSQLHMIFDLVDADYGITIVPYYVFERLQKPGLVAVPISDPSSRRTISLIVKKDDNRSKLLNAFVKYASKREQYSDLDCKLNK